MADHRLKPTPDDTRYPGNATLFYPLHPLFGRTTLVVRRSEQDGWEHVLFDGKADRVFVPVWMTNQQLCACMTLGFEPQCSLTALLDLSGLLRAAELQDPES